MAMDFPPPTLDGLDLDNGNSESGATILDLPKKCIVNIIKHVPLQNMDDIIELFPKWDMIVQENIPVEVHLTDIGFRIAHHYFIGFRDLSKYRIKVIHSRVLDEKIPELKCPEDLEMVEFPTHTEPSTFKILICKAVNLKELYFGYGSLSGQNLSGIEFDLPKLRILNIVDRPVEFKGNADTQNILPENIIGFLRKNFPSIRTLSVITSATRRQTVDYAIALLKFIENHCETLKSIKFEVATSFQSHLVDNESSLNDVMEISSEEKGFDMSRMSSVKLEELEINFGQNFFVMLEQWKEILSNQSNLVHLTVGSEKQLNPSVFAPPISLSASTLVSLQLGVDVVGGDPDRRTKLDFSILEQCSVLKSIHLIGPPFPDDINERPPISEIQNVEKLPKLLTTFKVENIYLETKQIVWITEEETKLQIVTLRNVGVTEEYGVSVHLLDSWIKAKKLKEIVLKGLNGKDVKLDDYEHLVKLGMTTPLTKCKVHCIYYTQLMEYRKPRENVVKKNVLST